MRFAFALLPVLALMACATTAPYEGTWRITTECPATATRPAQIFQGTADMYQNQEFEYVGDYQNTLGDKGTVLAKVDGNKVLAVLRFNSGGTIRATLTRVPGSDTFTSNDVDGCAVTAQLSG